MEKLSREEEIVKRFEKDIKKTRKVHKLLHLFVLVVCGMC